MRMATAASASNLPFTQVDMQKLKGNATLEFKLAVVNHYRDSNLYQTSLLNMKTILRWAGKKLKKVKNGSKRMVTARKAAFSRNGS